MNNQVRLRLKASIDQKSELLVLKQIQKLFELKSITIRNADKEFYGVEITCVKTLALVTYYLDTFKLKGRKVQAYAIWKPLVASYVNKTHLNLTRAEVSKKTQNVQELNQAFKQEKSVLTLLKLKTKIEENI
jgi:hypothetical protein